MANLYFCTAKSTEINQFVTDSSLMSLESLDHVWKCIAELYTSKYFYTIAVGVSITTATIS